MKQQGQSDEFLKNMLGRTALFLERTLFVPVGLYFACVKTGAVVQNVSVVFLVGNNFINGSADFSQIRFLCGYLTDFFLIFFNLTFTLGLIWRKNIYQAPDNFLEILVPLVSAFSMLFFDFVSGSTQSAVFWPIAAPWIPVVALTGSVFSFLGVIFSFWALFVLRNSLSVFVEVRDVVTGGPYAMVRHPIYLGYMVQLFGFCLVYQTFTALQAALFCVFFFIVRAVLEERKMCKHSAEYRRYRDQTPFLVPSGFFAKGKIVNKRSVFV